MARVVTAGTVDIRRVVINIYKRRPDMGVMIVSLRQQWTMPLRLTKWYVMHQWITLSQFAGFAFRFIYFSLKLQRKNAVLIMRESTPITHVFINFGLYY